MKIFRVITFSVGSVCAFGAAGTDQHFAEMGEMPPDGLGLVFVFGLVLMLPTLIYLQRKVKK